MKKLIAELILRVLSIKDKTPGNKNTNKIKLYMLANTNSINGATLFLDLNK
jgi:hypothetical protein